MRESWGRVGSGRLGGRSACARGLLCSETSLRRSVVACCLIAPVQRTKERS